MKKFLACDVDGTLISVTDDLSTETCAAIREFRKQGHVFSLCTGRTINWVAPLFKNHPLEADCLILANGASLYTVKSSQPFQPQKLSLNAIPAAVGAEIISYLYHNENVMLYWGDGEHTYELLERPMEIAASFNVSTEDTVRLSYADYLKAPMDIVGFGTGPLSQDTNEARRIAQTIKQRWGHIVDVVLNLFFCDVMVKSVSKGDGIKKMLQHLGSPLRAYGVGDSFNDEPMFQFIGQEGSFLMHDGDESLYPLVRRRVSSVAQCIEIILSEP